MPSTIERSSEKARETWAKTHDAAAEQYGDGERAHRTAFASLKHSFKKEGGKWVEKDERARELDIKGRSRMDKEELAEAIGKKGG